MEFKAHLPPGEWETFVVNHIDSEDQLAERWTHHIIREYFAQYEYTAGKRRFKESDTGCIRKTRSNIKRCMVFNDMQ